MWQKSFPLLIISYFQILSTFWYFLSIISTVFSVKTNWKVMKFIKEFSLCNKLKELNLFYFKLRSNWSNRTHSLKYLRSKTLGCKYIRIRKLKFVAMSQQLKLLTQCEGLEVKSDLLDVGVQGADLQRAGEREGWWLAEVGVILIRRSSAGGGRNYKLLHCRRRLYQYNEDDFRF